MTGTVTVCEYDNVDLVDFLVGTTIYYVSNDVRKRLEVYHVTSVSAQ